jgi:hypothetical protein
VLADPEDSPVGELPFPHPRSPAPSASATIHASEHALIPPQK